MPTLDEAIARLHAALGSQAPGVLRRLAHVPAALEWLREPAVIDAFAASGNTESPVTAVLLAATGRERLAARADDLPAVLAGRRDALLSGDEPTSPEDALILAAMILDATQAEGAGSVERLIRENALDWRAPLAAAWSAIADRPQVARALASSPEPRAVAALLAAARANASDAEAAACLVDSCAASLDRLVLHLVRQGDASFAAAIAAACGTTGDESPNPTEALSRRLQSGWDAARESLAAWSEAIASAAERGHDGLSAVEARRHALEVSPSDARLAALALTLAQTGDAAAALEALPPSSTSTPIVLATGAAYVAGGAIDKGRLLLIEAAPAEAVRTLPHSALTVAKRLVEAGETGLAIETLEAHLDIVPSDVEARTVYAQALRDGGDAEGALAQARIALAFEPESRLATLLQADALQSLGRHAEVITLLKPTPLAGEAEMWKRLAQSSIATGQAAAVDDILAAPPAGIGPDELDELRARAQASRGRLDDAVGILESALAERPSAESLWLALAEIRHDRDGDRASLETLERAAQMAPGSAAIRAALARCLRRLGRTSEALAAARAALNVEPRHAPAHYEAGAALLALGRPAEAVEHLRTANRRAPCDMETRIALASALEATGDVSAAASLFARLPDSAPAEAWAAAGRLALVGKDPIDPVTAKTAAGRLLRARAKGSIDPSLGYWLGTAFDLAGEPRHAAEAYADYVRRAPGDPERASRALLRKAHCLLACGDASAAIRDFEALRETRPDDRRVLEPLAHAYLAASLPDEACQTAEEMLASDPLDRQALAILTDAARTTGDWSRAARALAAAAATAGTDPGLWIDAAETGLKAGSKEKAKDALQAALANDPPTTVQRRAALLLVGLGDVETATRLMKSVAAEAPDDASVWIELADVAERAGERQTLVDAISRAADLAPDDPDVQARRAAALASIGRHADSIAAWRRSLELDPSRLAARRGLARALIARGDVQIALNELAEALARHPADPELLAEAGRAALRHGSAQEALDLLARADAASPANPRTQALTGEAWLRLRRPDRAADVLRRAVASPGASVSAWALLAEAALTQGDLVAAEDAIGEARRPEPDDLEDRIALARAEMRLGNWSDALTALAPALSDPDPRGADALASAIVRVEEARWLFAEAAHARRRAPSGSLPSESLKAWLETFLAGQSSDARQRTVVSLRRRLVESPEDDAALEDLATACAHEADDEACEALAMAHLRRNRPAEALDVLRRMSPDDLGASWQALLAGLAHLQAGNPSLARQAFLDAAADAGQRPVAQALLARAHLAQGYTESAVAALNNSLAQWPEEPAWHAELARLYRSLDDLDSALPHAQTAAELDPENAETLLAYARMLRQAGHLSDALLAYDRVLPLRAADAAVWHEAADVAMAAGDFARAAASFERAASLSPDEWSHRLGQARAASALGDSRHPRRAAEEALRLGGERPETLLCLATIHAADGDIQRALQALDRAAALDPDSPDLLRTRARILIDSGRGAQAAEELRARLAGHPEEEDSWAALAEALEAAGDLPAAAQALDAALRLTPRSVPLLIRQARLERLAGQLDHALDLLHQAETIDARHPELALEQGKVFEARREFDLALEAFERAAEIDPRAPEPLRRAAAVLKSLKAYEEAGQMLERAADLDPDDTTTLQQLAAVRALELVHGRSHRMAVTP